MAEDENLDRLTAKGLLDNKTIIVKNFLGGIAWGVGSLVGATVVVTLIVAILKSINFVPLIGNFVTQILQYVETRNLPLN